MSSQVGMNNISFFKYVFKGKSWPTDRISIEVHVFDINQVLLISHRLTGTTKGNRKIIGNKHAHL